MSSDITKLFKKYNQTCEMLKNLVDETLVAFHDIGPEMKISHEIEGILVETNIEQMKQEIGKRPLIVIGGQSGPAKASLLNRIIDHTLPERYTEHFRPVYLKYGETTSIRTTWNFEFEVVDDIREYRPRYVQDPYEDLYEEELHPLEAIIDEDDPWTYCVEIEIPNQFLKDGINVLILPEVNIRPDCRLLRGLHFHLNDYTPVILYGINEDFVTTQTLQYIHKIIKEYPLPFLFVSMASNDETSATDSLTESTQHSLEYKNELNVNKIKSDLLRVVHVIDADAIDTDELLKRTNNIRITLNAITSGVNFERDILTYGEHILKLHLLKQAKKLSNIHNKCVKRFILSAFDMARQIQITPQRMYYARAEEQRLYLELKVYADDQQNCLTSIITSVLHEMKTNIQEFLTEYDETCNSSTDRFQTAREAKLKMQDLILQRLRNKVAQRLSTSIACLQECFTGTLERCLKNIEKSCDGLENNGLASNALKQIITAAYNIDIRATTSFSVIHIFMDHCKKLFLDYILPVSGRWPLADTRYGPPNLEEKIHCVTTIINRLSSSKLAKTISLQFRDQIKSSHDAFLLAVRLLDNQLSGKLEQTEEQRILIRKKHAPKFARLALESTSLYDYIIYDMPKQYVEIGRGQYGVVYSCEQWGGIESCAFKSVVPPDDRHWNDLAMEFYYTRSIPEHPRILKLRGSVIDYTYGGGSSPAVLLIMERMFRDLHCGLRQGLDWMVRLQIAIDVVAGLRYLHSQGLVHRDIKLKNVLLDKNNRAKLTDFGFCIPEAMMSGSIVGTPVHMAPELLLGRYDSSVDVYAFGILFWYICSGQVKLPNRFDQFQNKEQLWNNVRRGIRPEYLTQFSKPCWNLMQQCWAGEPSERPLLGDVELKLHAIFTDCKEDLYKNE